jgi:flagellar biosynthetic protein FliO
MKSRQWINLGVLAGCGLCCALVLCAAAGAAPSAVAVNAPPEVALDTPTTARQSEPVTATKTTATTTASSSSVADLHANDHPQTSLRVAPSATSAASAASAVSASDVSSGAPAAAADDVEGHDIGGKRSEAPAAGAGPKPGKPAGGWMDFALPLAAVLALIVAVVWVVKKYLPNVRRLTGSTAMKVVARTHLSPRQSIAVVRLGRRLLVVGQTAENLTPLGVVEDPEEVSELLGEIESGKAASAVGHFNKVFQKTNDEFAAADEPAEGEIDRVRTELESLTRKVREVTGGTNRAGSKD